MLQQCLGEGLTVFDVDDDGNNDNSFCSYTHRFVFRYYHFGFNEKDPGFKKKTLLKEPIEIIKLFVYFKYIKQKPELPEYHINIVYSINIIFHDTKV